MKTVTLTLASVCAFACVASAQSNEPAQPSLFERVDINQDGYVSFSEIVSLDSNATAASIMRFDPNFDQRLTEAQFEQYLKASPLPKATFDAQERTARREAQRSAPPQQPRQSGGFGS